MSLRLLISLAFTLAVAPMSVYAQSNTTVVTGYVIESDIKHTRVVDASVRCQQIAGPSVCSARRTDEDGRFRLVDAPLKGIKVTAIQYNSNAVLVGEAYATCEQDKPTSTKPKPIVVKRQATGAAVNRSGRNELVVVMTPIALTQARRPQNPSEPIPRPTPSRVAGTITTGDKGNPQWVRVRCKNDETNELCFPDALREFSSNLTQGRPEPKSSFELPHLPVGKYGLEFAADGYYPANYLIIVQDPGVRSVGDTTEQAIPLIVIKTDGTNVDPSAMSVVLQPLADTEEESLGQLINTEDATRRGLFQPTLMEALPVAAAGSVDSFALLSPGVHPPPQSLGSEGPGVSPGVGTAGQFSVNGLRSRANNFNIDGSDNNDEDLGIRRQGFVFLAPQPRESIGEFQIITALGDARFGRDIGAQVNAVTKTGGEYLHGSLYGRFSTQALNSRDRFDGIQEGQPPSFALTRSVDNSPIFLDGRPLVLPNPVEGKNPFSRRRWGLTSGGPLGWDTFFFTSFESVNTRERRESHFAVPRMAQRGVFDSGETGLLNLSAQGVAPFYPTSVPGAALFSLYPFPNNPYGPYGENTYTEVLPADSSGRQLSVKIEKHLGRKQTERRFSVWNFLWVAPGDLVTGRYNISQDARTIPVTGGALFSSLRPHVRTQNASFFLNRSLSSNLSDAIRLSFGRTRLTFDEVRDDRFLLPSSFFPNTPWLLNAPLLLNLTAPNLNGTLNPTTYISASSPQGAAILNSLGYSGITQVEQIAGALGQVVIPGFSPVGVDVTYFPQARANNTIQAADTISYQRGKSLLTFGFDVRKNQINSVQERNFRPTATFNGFVGDAPTNDLLLFTASHVPIPAQTFSGSTLAAGGISTGLFQTLATVPNSSIGIRFAQINTFVQHDRNFKPNLRITLGLRYELNTVPSTINKRLEGAFDPLVLRREVDAALPVCSILVSQARCAEFGNALAAAFPADFKVSFGSDRNDFSPRVGFAWQPFNDSRTVIRGGFGIYTGQFNGFVLGQSRNTFPDYLSLNFASSPSQPPLGGRDFLFNPANPLASTLSNVTVPGTLNTLQSGESPVFILINRLGVVQRLAQLGGFRRLVSLDLVLPQKELISPYALQYGVTVERQFGANTVASVAYVGTRGIKLLRTSTPEGGANYSRFESFVDLAGVLRNLIAVRPLGNSAFPSFGGLIMPPRTSIVDDALAIPRTLFESSGSSSYNSFQAEIRKRYSRNFEFGTSVTFAHSIDDVSDYLDLAGAYALPQNSSHRSERASSNFDIRWRSVSHFVYDFPFRLHWRAEHDGKLEIAAIVTAQGGQPFTVNSAFDINRDGNLTDRLNTTNGLTFGSGLTQLEPTPGVDPRSLLAQDGQDGLIGRNTFRAPPVLSLDLALTAKMPISEQRRILFRIETFNCLNQANYGIPVRILEAPGFGNSINTVVSPRMIQFAIKYDY